MTEDALAALRQYHWPGNVRELRNLVERVLILNPKTQRIERKHLPMLVYRGPGKLTESAASTAAKSSPLCSKPARPTSATTSSRSWMRTTAT